MGGPTQCCGLVRLGNVENTRAAEGSGSEGKGIVGRCGNVRGTGRFLAQACKEGTVTIRC